MLASSQAAYPENNEEHPKKTERAGNSATDGPSIEVVVHRCRDELGHGGVDRCGAGRPALGIVIAGADTFELRINFSLERASERGGRVVRCALDPRNGVAADQPRVGNSGEDRGREASSGGSYPSVVSRSVIGKCQQRPASGGIGSSGAMPSMIRDPREGFRMADDEVAKEVTECGHVS